jgi:beta-galactosidase
LNNAELTAWKMYKVPFNTVNGLLFTANKKTEKLQPALYKGTFTLTKTGDTYLDMHGFGKGFVFLNGRNLGKYWEIGPQQTIYIPAPWLKKGVNEIVVFDQLKDGHTEIHTLDHPVLNEVVKE